MKKALISAVIGGVCLTTNAGYAAEIKVGWDPPATNEDGSECTDLEGYRAFYSSRSGDKGAVYKSHSSCGTDRCVTILTGLSVGEAYDIYVRAYDTSGNKSKPSKTISAVASVHVPDTPDLPDTPDTPDTPDDPDTPGADTYIPGPFAGEPFSNPNWSLGTSSWGSDSPFNKPTLEQIADESTLILPFSEGKTLYQKEGVVMDLRDFSTNTLKVYNTGQDSVVANIYFYSEFSGLWWRGKSPLLPSGNSEFSIENEDLYLGCDEDPDYIKRNDNSEVSRVGIALESELPEEGKIKVLEWGMK